MLLSELLKIEENDLEGLNIKNGSVYNVIIDIEEFTPPDWLKEVGIIYQDQDGVLSDLVMDIVINYSLSGKDVIVEVPFEENVDVEYLLSLASNIEVSLSLLPPKDINDENMAIYTQRLKDMTEVYLSQKSENYNKYIFPISNYIEYLMINLLDKDREFVPKDSYIVNYFDIMNKEVSNKMKDNLREHIYELHGGQELFEKTTLEIMYKNI